MRVAGFGGLGEGFGLPVLEAMACDAPVLTTRRLSLPEVGSDAVAYANSPGEADLAAALTSLLADANRRRQLSAAGHRAGRGVHVDRGGKSPPDGLRPAPGDETRV